MEDQVVDAPPVQFPAQQFKVSGAVRKQQRFMPTRHQFL